AGNAHAHDGGELRDPLGAHDRVVAKHAAKVVGIGEDIFLQREEDAGGIDQINRGKVVFDGDVLGTNDLFCGHREKRAGFDGGVVGDDHEQAPANAAQARDGTCGRGAAPFLVHLVGGVNAQLKKT